MYYIGLISGTSMDAVDAVLVDFEPIPLQIIAHHARPLPAPLQLTLKALTPETPLAAILALDVQIGELFATTALELLQQAAVDKSRIAAIGSHGQTVWHMPGQLHTSLQVGDPNRIAWLTGITTVADFRRMDMAAGGEGAPLAPAFHAAAFRHPHEDRVLLNLGGIANITVLPADPQQAVTGFDTGPANTLLDAWARQHLQQPFDENGAWAATGEVDPALLRRLLADSYFPEAAPKSTGPEYFNLDWLAQHGIEECKPADVQATLVQLTADSVAAAVWHHAPNAAGVWACGGGVNNPVLMQALATALRPLPVDSTATLGVKPGLVEAACFAWLARERLAGRPGNLPAVTGARQAVPLGGIYIPTSQ